MTVNPVADDPIANDDAAETLIGAPVQIDLLANDSDADGPISIDGFTQPANGSVVVNGGVATYSPNPGFEGQDSFSYTIIDSDNVTAAATATVDVVAEPTGPTPIFTASSFAPGVATIVANESAFQTANAAIEVAFNLNSLGGRNSLASKDAQGNDNGGHVFVYVEGADLKVRLQDASSETNSTYTLIADNVVSANQDHHVVVNVGDDGFELFLDGGLLAFDASVTESLESNSEDWVIGGNQWLSDPGATNDVRDVIDGEILEFSFYDRALEDAEVTDQAADYVTIL